MWWKQSGGREVRRILMEEWDPIGVSGIPEAIDEYDRYVGQVGQMLREAATAEAIAAYLAATRLETMGLLADDTSDRSVAATLRGWYDSEMRQRTRPGASHES
jgi:hypothetical protein